MKLWKKICKIGVPALLSGCLLLLPLSAAEAAGKALVNWSPNIFLAGEATADSLLRVKIDGQKDVSQEIARTLTERLQSLGRQGKLPFQLNQTGTSDADVQAISDEEGLSLQPFVALDTSFDSKLTVNGQTVYRSIILSSLDVAVASWDSSTQEYRMLGMVPLSTYTVLERSQPYTAQEKAKAYGIITEKMIQESLDFSQNKKMFEDLDMRSINTQEDTWQVADVAMSSKKAQEVFDGQQNKLRRLVASFFASSYQQATGKTVLPSTLETGYYGKDVKANFSAFTLSSPLGSRTMTFPKAKHQVTLDVVGVNSAVMDEDKSDVLRHVGYRAWLRGRLTTDPQGGSSEKTLDVTTYEKEYKTDNVELARNPVDTYTTMYLNLSQDLGQVMAGKKLKKK